VVILGDLKLINQSVVRNVTDRGIQKYSIKLANNVAMNGLQV
jgi:hypothetical protein